MQRPESYEDAVQEKETARTEIDLAVNERDQEILKIEAEVLRGEQQVLEILDTAYTNANVTILEAKVNAEAVVYLIQTYQDYFTRAKSTLGFSEPEEVLQWFENRLYSNKDKTMSVEFPSQIGYGVHANGDADEAGNWSSQANENTINAYPGNSKEQRMPSITNTNKKRLPAIMLVAGHSLPSAHLPL